MKMHMVSAINDALRLEMKQDESILLLGEDIGVDGGVFRVTDGLINDFGEERVIDTPLAEAGIIGCAIGMAINGLKPVPEIQFSGFSYQAFHHFKQHIARFRQRSHGTISLPMVIRTPCSGGIRALEHHSESPESFFIHCQGIKVVMPSNPYDAKGMMIAALRDPNPVLFLEPKKIYRSFKDDVPEESYEVPLGEAKYVKEGSDVSIITWGAMTRLCLECVEDLEKEGINVEILDLRTLWPFDIDKIVETAKKTGKVVVVQEATRACSLSSEIVAQLQERVALNLKAPVERVTGFDLPFPHFALENYFLPNKKRVITAIKKVHEF